MVNKVILTANRSDDLQSLLKGILNLILKFMDFEGGGIYLIDENEGLAKLEHFTGISQDFIQVVGSGKISKYPYNEVCVHGNHCL